MAADQSSPIGAPRAQTVLLQEKLTRRILRVYYDVYNELGGGFLESVYARAFEIALEEAGLPAIREVPVPVRFRGRVIGDFRADFLIDATVLVETKAVRRLEDADAAQLVNYLRATDLEIGMLLNFGPRPEFRRMVLQNARRTIRVDPR